jgi:hypothetical protein
MIVTLVGQNAKEFQKALSTGMFKLSKIKGHRINLGEMAKKYVSIGSFFEPLSLEDLTDQELIAKITGSKGTISNEGRKEVIVEKKIEVKKVIKKDDPFSNLAKGIFKKIKK